MQHMTYQINTVNKEIYYWNGSNLSLYDALDAIKKSFPNWTSITVTLVNMATANLHTSHAPSAVDTNGETA